MPATTYNRICSLQHRLGLGSPVAKNLCWLLTEHSFLPSLPSILRKALDKIAEIKSLLEERRIGEWEKCRAFLDQTWWGPGEAVTAQQGAWHMIWWGHPTVVGDRLRGQECA